MTNAIYIAAIIVQLGVIIYFVRKNKKKPQAPAASNAEAPKKDSYEDQRSIALSVTPAQLKLGIPDSETFVYGIVMDWNMGDTLVTLVCFITGAASMYLSSGGGVVGGGKNPSVGEAAAELVTMAQDYIDRTIPITTFDLPGKDSVRFYLLSNHHRHAAQEQVARLDDTTSPWLPLFEKANEVILEMRAVLN
jgi:hypothetical protein